MPRPATDKRKLASHSENGVDTTMESSDETQADAKGASPDAEAGHGSVVEVKTKEAARPPEHGLEKTSPSPRAGDVADNYQYWREHGGEWAEEYDQRKLVVPLYHVQEIMLTEYVAHHAPAKVLEFGCGPGRHLRNLSRIPGVDANGYDQSAAMVSGCLRWTNQKWIDEHVTVGLPTGRLPFEDGAFDLVYSAEVLVHVRPEDLLNVLSELMRISKRQVFHLEPDEHVEISPDDHLGCWKHDLVAAYAKLGKKCEILTSGYKAHAPYRVILDESAPTWEWSPLLASLYRRLETDLSKGFADLRASEAAKGAALDEAQRTAAEAETLRARVTELTASVEQLRTALAAQRTITREQITGLLSEIEAERARSAQALTAQWSTLHHLRSLFPER